MPLSTSMLSDDIVRNKFAFSVGSVGLANGVLLVGVKCEEELRPFQPDHS